MTPQEYLKTFDNLQVIMGNRNSAAALLSEKVSAVIMSILSDMEICKDYLAELNDHTLQKLGDDVVLPEPPSEYRMVYNTRLPVIPNAPHPIDVNIQNVFAEVLHEEEKKMGVNQDGVPELAQIVPNNYADLIVYSNHLWSDHVVDADSYAHGRFSHRIQHYIVKRAIEDERVDLSLINELINLKEPGVCFKYLLLSELVYAYEPKCNLPGKAKSLWIHTIDSDKPGPTDLRDPLKLTQYLLSPEGFEQYPFMARAFYYPQYNAIFSAAKGLNQMAEDIFQALVDFKPQYELGAPMEVSELFRSTYLHLFTEFKNSSDNTQTFQKLGNMVASGVKNPLDFDKMAANLYESARTKQKEGNFSGAITDLSCAQKIYEYNKKPKMSGQIIYGRALVFSKMGEHGNAANDLEKAIQIGERFEPKPLYLQPAIKKRQKLQGAKGFAFRFN